MSSKGWASSLVSLSPSTEAPGVILVYLYGPECPACSEFESSWRLFKEMHKGEATFIELDVNNIGGKLAKNLGIKYIPAVIVFKDGAPIDKMEGFPDIKDLEYSLIKAKNKRF